MLYCAYYEVPVLDLLLEVFPLERIDLLKNYFDISFLCRLANCFQKLTS